MNKIIVILIIISTIIVSSCKKNFDYSPNVIDFDEENTNVNAKNIAKINNKRNADHIITIALIADNHLDYDEFEAAVSSVNQLNNTIDIDFTFHMGDIADFGLPKQYLWGNGYLQKLETPYIVTLGNHDLVGNGGDSYSEMFGEYNFSFIYDSIKFIFVNTNSLEFNFNGKVPDIGYLENQLIPSANFKKAVVLMHVPPVNDDFDKSLELAFRETIVKYNNVICVVHGHTHSHSVYYPYPDGMAYIGIYSVRNKKFNLLKIINNEFSVSTYEF